jgi:hypothetical protein
MQTIAIELSLIMWIRQSLKGTLKIDFCEDKETVYLQSAIMLLVFHLYSSIHATS